MNDEHRGKVDLYDQTSRSASRFLGRGGTGTFEENTNWVQGHSIVEEAKGTNERVPVLFASATRIDFLLFCALLKKVDVVQIGEHSWQTEYSFERLTAIPMPHQITELVSLLSGKQLSAEYIRPYVPCHTPVWVSRVLQFQDDAV